MSVLAFLTIEVPGPFPRNTSEVRLRGVEIAYTLGSLYRFS